MAVRNVVAPLVRLFLLIYAIYGSVHQYQSSPNFIDFDQLYFGAVIGLSGEWDLLYPIPHPNAERNAGVASDPKPEAAKLYFQRTERKCPGFIYPPAAAVLLAPLALVDFATAKMIWAVLGGICIWGIGGIADAIYRSTLHVPRGAWLGLVIHAVLVLTPRYLYELSHGNVSQVIGLLLAAVVLALLRDRPSLALIFMLIAACIKVTPICLIVLLVPRRFWPSWKSLLAIAMAGIAMVLLTRPATWIEFARVIVPTLSKTWLPDYPQDLCTASIHGIIGLWLEGSRLTPGWEWAIRIGALACLALLLVCFLRDRSRLAAEPYRLIAFATGLVAWSLLFSPILWYHYLYYYLFCLPWLLALLRTSWLSISLSALTLFFLFCPWGRVPPFRSSFYAAQMMPGWIALLLIVLSVIDGLSTRPRQAFTLMRNSQDSR